MKEINGKIIIMEKGKWKKKKVATAMPFGGKSDTNFTD